MCIMEEHRPEPVGNKCLAWVLYRNTVRRKYSRLLEENIKFSIALHGKYYLHSIRIFLPTCWIWHRFGENFRHCTRYSLFHKRLWVFFIYYLQMPSDSGFFWLKCYKMLCLKWIEAISLFNVLSLKSHLSFHTLSWCFNDVAVQHMYVYILNIYVLQANLIFQTICSGLVGPCWYALQEPTEENGLKPIEKSPPPPPISIYGCGMLIR